MTTHNIESISVESIHPNKYNPNRMDDDAFAEYVAEVKHLGRLPKPMVVRQNEDGYETIDGEHGWRAAKDVGFAEVPCEIIEADDFEAMRQTYKRNQHGEHDRVLLGKMFCAMMSRRKLSARKFAKEVGVSEGTIRNALEYEKAARVRNSCAIGNLSIRQVRLLNKLPKVIGGWWLDTGADLKTLTLTTTTDQMKKELRWHEEDILERYERLEATGLTGYVEQPQTKGRFTIAIEQLDQWSQWQQDWCHRWVERDELNKYVLPYIEVFGINTEPFWLATPLDLIIDAGANAFRLTPDEFRKCIEECEHCLDLADEVELAIRQKGITITKDEDGVALSAREHLMAMDVKEGAPDYIKNSKLDIKDKHGLMELSNAGECSDEALRKVAASGEIWHSHRGLKGGVDRVQKQINEQKERQERIDNFNHEDAAMEVAKRFHEADSAECKTMAHHLEKLTKEELLAMDESHQKNDCRAIFLAQVGIGIHAELDSELVSKQK